MQISSPSPVTLATTPTAAQPTPARKPAGEGSFAQALAEASREVAEPPASKPSLKAQGLPPLFKYADDGVITGDEMRLALNDAKADYRHRLSAAFSELGIDTSSPLTLQVDTQGRVVVAGDHPDKARIEARFADDDKLANAFKQILSLSQMLAHGEEAIAFHQAYDLDPQAAVARYAHLFNSTLMMTMSHRWGPDGLEVDVTSERVLRSAWR